MGVSNSDGLKSEAATGAGVAIGDRPGSVVCESTSGGWAGCSELVRPFERPRAESSAAGFVRDLAGRSSRAGSMGDRRRESKSSTESANSRSPLGDLLWADSDEPVLRRGAGAGMRSSPARARDSSRCRTARTRALRSLSALHSSATAGTSTKKNLDCAGGCQACPCRRLKKSQPRAGGRGEMAWGWG
jgi:hypothetical protein